MIVLAMLSLIPCMLTGLLLCQRLWPDISKHGWSMRISFGFLTGYACHALGYQLLMLVHAQTTFTGVLITDVLLVIISVLLWRYRSSKHTQSISKKKSAWTDRLLSAGTLVLLGIAMTGVYHLMSHQVHGHADAYAFWNLKARFMAAGQSHWPHLFSPELTQSDYPLLFSSGLARGWRYALNHLTPTWPMAMSFVFAGILLLLTFSAIKLEQGVKRGLLGVIILAGGMPFLLFHVSSQYADHLYACYLLGVMVLIDQACQAQGKRLLWCYAGLLAGIASATKNEGLVLCLTLTLSILLLNDNRIKKLVWLILGMLPFVSWNILCKLTASQLNPLFIQSPDDGPFQRLLQWERHQAVLSTFLRVIRYDFDWRMLLLLVTLPLVMGVKKTLVREPMFKIWLLVLILNALAYELVFAVLSYGDVREFAGQGINRVCLHLWPLVVWGCLRWLKDPQNKHANEIAESNKG